MFEIPDSMKKKIKGKRCIGAGGTRIVYDLGNGNVLKIAKSRMGIQCNQTEVIIYKNSSKRIKRYLAQITDYDKSYRWLAMEKHDLKFPNQPQYRRKLKTIVKKFLEQGIIPSNGVGRYDKPYRPNLRLTQTRQIVVIDYGGFKYKGK